MISELTFKETVEWIRNNKTGIVCCCTLNEIMMADNDIDFRRKLFSADLLTPDGMPLVWWLKWKKGKGERVYGPDLMGAMINDKRAKDRHLFVGDEKNKEYFEKYGDYVVMPMKDSFEENDYKNLVKEVNKSKSQIVWLGLGAKKQVETAFELKKRGVKKVMITVGAAFDFLSGNKKQCPKWIRDAGGEWIYRLINEPKRLGVRYWKIIQFLVRKLF